MPDPAPAPSRPPTIDVIIAAYNASATVERAVRSALAEPEVARVIVVDDASADDTADVARAAGNGDPRMIVERVAANVGPSAARNLALDKAQSPWVAVLDADDSLLPGRFSRLLRYAGDADLVADDLLVVTEGSDAAPAPMFDPPVTQSGKLDAAMFIAGNISHNRKARCDLGFMKPLVRRAVLSSLSDGFRPDMRLGEDYELYARLLLGGARGKLVPQCGYLYMVSPNSLSGAHTTEALRRFRDCDRRLSAIAGITPDQRRWIRRHYRSVDARLQWQTLIEAVKERDVAAALRTFARSLTVTGFLAGQLWEQARLRSRRRLFGNDIGAV